jgi:hypothetical protein
MKCIVCGFENPEAGKQCSFCGKPLVERPPTSTVAAGATAAAAVAVAPQPPPSPEMINVVPESQKSHKTAFIVAAVCAAIFVMVFLGFVGFGFFGYLVQSQQKATVGRLAHEALSGQAQSDSGQQGEMQALIRDYFKQVRDLNVSYRQQVADLNISQLPKIYSVETFATPGAMRRAQSEIVSIWKVDSDQEDNLRALQQKMRDQINSGNWSDFQKKAFIEGFDTGAGRVVALREPMVATEKDWVDAANDLYQYAMDNASSIEVQNGRVAINDADIRDTFNQKMHTAEEKYSTMQSSKQSYDQQIAQMTRQSGLSQEDFRALQGQQ